MSIRISHLWIGLAKVWFFAHQVLKELCLESLVSGFWEERLFLKDGQKLHGFLKHVNARLQVHAKVNISPVKTLSDIFLLFESEHVLVEELLEFLIDVIDADLLKGVKLKNLKTSNIQDSAEVGLLERCVN